MDIKNFIKTNRWFLAALLTIIVIIVVILSLRAPAVDYKVETGKVSILLKEKNSLVNPIELFKSLSQKSQNAILVDVRSGDEFAKGHIENAISLPTRELLETRSLTLFRESKKSGKEIILYGNTQLEASGPWLLLRQVGFDNIKMLQGGYSFFKTLPLSDSLLNVDRGAWDVELSQVYTSAFKKVNTEPVKAMIKATPKAEKVIPVKKTGSTGGGC